jgi:hypothetical protein
VLEDILQQVRALDMEEVRRKIAEAESKAGKGEGAADKSAN